VLGPNLVGGPRPAVDEDQVINGHLGGGRRPANKFAGYIFSKASLRRLSMDGWWAQAEFARLQAALPSWVALTAECVRKGRHVDVPMRIVSRNMIKPCWHMLSVCGGGPDLV
jgi:hypothetical protein